MFIFESRWNDLDLISLVQPSFTSTDFAKISSAVSGVNFVWKSWHTHAAGCELSAEALKVYTINITWFFQSAVSKRAHRQISKVSFIDIQFLYIICSKLYPDEVKKE